jgi:hypothetical protein
MRTKLSQTGRRCRAPLNFRNLSEDDADRREWMKAGRAKTSRRSSALEWDADNSETWMWVAALHRQVGDEAGYRRVCREMLDRFGDSDIPYLVERTAKTCALAPAGVDDPNVLVGLADRALEGHETHAMYWYYLLAKGMAEFRAGHDALAVHFLQRTSPSVFRAAPWDATIFSVLAMASHRLGQAQAASNMLEGTRTILDGRFAPAEDGAAELETMEHDWMHAQILYREAAATLAEPAPGGAD